MAENMNKTFIVVLMLIGVVFLSGCIATDKDIDEITKQAKEKYATIEDYQVDVVVTPDAGIPFTGNSTRFVMREKFKQPNKYVAEIIEAPKDVGTRTVSDGVFVWRESPSMAYIERASLDSRGVPKPFDFTSALQQAKQFSEFLNIKFQGIESIDNRMAYKLTAVPKEESLAGQFSAHVWIDSERLIPLRMSWPGLTVNYTNIKINEGIPDNEFTFSVPEGKLVVEAESIHLGFLGSEFGQEKIGRVDETSDAYNALTLAEAEENLPFQLLLPTNLPKGFRFNSIELDEFHQPAVYAISTFSNPDIVGELSVEQHYSSLEAFESKLASYAPEKMADYGGISKFITLHGSKALIASKDKENYFVMWYFPSLHSEFALRQQGDFEDPSFATLSEQALLSIAESVTCGNESIDAGETAENCCPDVRGEADAYCKVWMCMGLEEYEEIRSGIENYSRTNFEVVEPTFLPEGVFLAGFEVLEYRSGVKLTYKKDCSDLAFEVEALPGEQIDYNFYLSAEETKINGNPGYLVGLKNVDTGKMVISTIYWYNEMTGINFKLQGLNEILFTRELGEQFVQIAESIPSAPPVKEKIAEKKPAVKEPVVESEPIDKCKDVQCETYQTCVDGECIINTCEEAKGGDCILKTCKEANGYICNSPAFICGSESFMDLEGKVCCKEQCKSQCDINPCKSYENCVEGQCV